MKRTIFHIDVNSAFLSWEAAYRINILGETIDIRNEVAAIGGDVEKRHGIILAKSIPAKKYHIQTGEPILDAVRKCPSLKIYRPDYDLYDACSRAFMDLLGEYTDRIEQYSIDEAYMEVTEILWKYHDPMNLAMEIKNRIRKELGFTVNIGISTNKLLAKMASDFKKPDRIHTLYPGEVPLKMWPLPVQDLFYAGPATCRKLAKLEIRTIGELAMGDPHILQKHLKKQGLIVWNYAKGIDKSPLIVSPPPNKGYGNSTTTSFSIETEEQAKSVLLGICESVGARLRKDKVEAKTIGISIRYQETLKTLSRQTTLSEPTNCTNILYRETTNLLSRTWDLRAPLRQMGVQASAIVPEDRDRQLTIFQDAKHDKLRKMDAVVDNIRKRYGTRAIMRSVFLQNQNIAPVCGGVSEEKRGIHAISNCTKR